MDTSGCPRGFATDRVFLYGDDFTPGACNASIAFFATCMAIISALRILLACFHLQQWISRYKKNVHKATTNKTKRRRRRLPIFPLLSMIAAVSVTLFTILVSLNLASARNGLPAFFLGLFYFPMGLMSMIMTQRMVTAGRKLIPLSNTMMSSSETPSGTSDASQTTARLKRLENVYLLLKILRVIGFAANIILLPASLMIASLISPTFVPFQIGLISLFISDWAAGVGLAYQFQRVINAIKAIQKDQVHGTTSKPTFAVASSRLEAVHTAIRRMRMTQMAIFLCCSAASVMWILNASRVVLPFYWFSILYFGIEVVCFASIAISSAFVSRKDSSSKSPTNSREVAAGNTENITAPKGPSYLEPSLKSTSN